MNDKPINSMISAYHDGELTAAERTEVERLLASSPEAQTELKAYRQMSSLLREAGRPTLKADLTPSVMQTIEQQKVQPTRATRPLERSKAAQWAAMAAVAAGLIAVVGLTWQTVPGGREVANLPHQNQTIPSVGAGEVTPQPNTNVAVAANSAKPADKTTREKLITLKPADLPLEVIENLKQAQPGKIVRFLKNSGKDVAVFHLMVLDTQPGLESLQMILSAQQISGPKGQVGQSGVMAVYVEANQDQLDKVIAELQSAQQPQFVALAVQPMPMKDEEVRKVMKNQATDVASKQIPLKPGELKSLGVNPVEEQQIADSRSNRSRSSAGTQAMSRPGENLSTRKLLFVLEKAPQSLLPKTDIPN